MQGDRETKVFSSLLSLKEKIKRGENFGVKEKKKKKKTLSIEGGYVSN